MKGAWLNFATFLENENFIKQINTTYVEFHIPKIWQIMKRTIY